MKLPEITEIRRLTVRPGDRLVVSLEYEPTDAEVDELGRRLPAVLGTDVPIVILPPSMDITVIGPEADGPQKVRVELSGGDGEELVRWLRECIRRRGGGSVQRALGST
jgi:hypothetical protein